MQVCTLPAICIKLRKVQISRFEYLVKQPFHFIPVGLRNAGTFLSVCFGWKSWVRNSVKHTHIKTEIHRVSHELRSLLRGSVPYVKIYRYIPKHLCPKLNGYGDNGKRKVWTS